MQGSANLNVMVTAARKAGRGLAKDFREVENLQVTVKGPGDFVTRADRNAEETIRSELTGARPNYGWLGEESGPEVPGKDPTRRWIVDPLDGTTNFLHGMPHWAISIALEHKGEVVAAVIFDAAKDEMFTAERGAGAWMNGMRLRVSGRRKMTDAILGTNIPFSAQRTLPAMIHDLGRLSPACAGIRSLGASALDLAYVAAGRLDGCWSRDLHPWDCAAGLLLVREAGGFVEPLRPDGSIFDSGMLIAAAPGIFEKLTGALREPL